MNRWKATLSYEWSGAWEGRPQMATDYDTKTDVCGHLHGSSAEAGRCAHGLAAQRNAMLVPVDSRMSYGMPSDYYLG